MKYNILYLFFCLSLSPIFSFSQLPDGFVYLHNHEPNIQVELRYCTQNNFIGNIIDGYNAELIIVTKPTAVALGHIQAELENTNLALKIFDAYRPQQAVNHFVKWAKNTSDTLMKAQYYPKVLKKNLFKSGYISSHSRHSSGSTLDVTIVDTVTGEELDMGSPYDFFGEQSWIEYPALTSEQKKNRKLLQNIMSKHGFRNYSKEWWHFTLRNEPYRNQYFNFPIE